MLFSVSDAETEMDVQDQMRISVGDLHMSVAQGADGDLVSDHMYFNLPALVCEVVCRHNDVMCFTASYLYYFLAKSKIP